MTVMIDKASLRFIHKRAQKTKENIKEKINEINKLGDNASDYQRELVRTYEKILEPQ